MLQGYVSIQQAARAERRGYSEQIFMSNSRNISC